MLSPALRAVGFKSEKEMQKTFGKNHEGKGGGNGDNSEDDDEFDDGDSVRSDSEAASDDGRFSAAALPPGATTGDLSSAPRPLRSKARHLPSQGGRQAAGGSSSSSGSDDIFGNGSDEDGDEDGPIFGNLQKGTSSRSKWAVLRARVIQTPPGAARPRKQHVFQPSGGGHHARTGGHRRPAGRRGRGGHRHKHNTSVWDMDGFGYATSESEEEGEEEQDDDDDDGGGGGGGDGTGGDGTDDDSTDDHSDGARRMHGRAGSDSDDGSSESAGTVSSYSDSEPGETAADRRARRRRNNNRRRRLLGEEVRSRHSSDYYSEEEENAAERQAEHEELRRKKAAKPPPASNPNVLRYEEVLRTELLRAWADQLTRASKKHSKHRKLAARARRAAEAAERGEEYIPTGTDSEDDGEDADEAQEGKTEKTQTEADTNMHDDDDGDTAPLPPGWQEHVDPTTGDTYYFHEDDPTGTTTWDRPSATGPRPGPTLLEKMAASIVALGNSLADATRPAEDTGNLMALCKSPYDVFEDMVRKPKLLAHIMSHGGSEETLRDAQEDKKEQQQLEEEARSQRLAQQAARLKIGRSATDLEMRKEARRQQAEETAATTEPHEVVVQLPSGGGGGAADGDPEARWGSGLECRPGDGQVVFCEVEEGGPAWVVGIRGGDVFLKVAWGDGSDDFSRRIRTRDLRGCVETVQTAKQQARMVWGKPYVEVTILPAAVDASARAVRPDRAKGDPRRHGLGDQELAAQRRYGVNRDGTLATRAATPGTQPSVAAAGSPGSSSATADGGDGGSVGVAAAAAVGAGGDPPAERRPKKLQVGLNRVRLPSSDAASKWGIGFHRDRHLGSLLVTKVTHGGAAHAAGFGEGDEVVAVILPSVRATVQAHRRQTARARAQALRNGEEYGARSGPGAQRNEAAIVLVRDPLEQAYLRNHSPHRTKKRKRVVMRTRCRSLPEAKAVLREAREMCRDAEEQVECIVFRAPEANLELVVGCDSERGHGIRLRVENGYTVVGKVTGGTNAWEAGLQKGDVVVAVEGYGTSGPAISKEGARELLRHAVASARAEGRLAVRLLLYRKGLLPRVK